MTRLRDDQYSHLAKSTPNPRTKNISITFFRTIKFDVLTPLVWARPLSAK